MATILTKKKDTTGAPSAGDLTNSTGGAELAVNTADKRLYTKDSGGNVVEVGINPTSITTGTLNTSGAVVFNDAGADVDFRVEGDGEANLLFVDASADAVIVNGTVAAGSTGGLTLNNTTSGSVATQLALRSSGTGNGSGSQIGFRGVSNTGAEHDYGYVTVVADDTTAKTGSMRFSTTAGSSPVERVRITSGGFFKASNTGSYAGATDNHHEFSTSLSGGVIFRNRNTSAVPYGEEIQFTGASPDNNTNYFLLCVDSTANRTIIYSDGDVWTSDAGTLSSDQKLKNTITDASPKLDDVMRLRVRNFYWNEDYHPEKTDKKLIGFIAQEFEEVFPGLVTEGVIRGGQPIYEDQAVVDDEGNPVLDEDGNPKTEQVQVGETEKEYAKGIKEGKLIPILVKALQEAVERIETLEAKVAALENA